uniref:ATP synthase complex subunit 8 n=1 Tax=Sitona obsoletus TaxID=1541163 RepID=A0A411LWK2_9CUCU|nr:ATP synthase F0 subunit 8 [Sitona obsoletus]QBF03823.1 ATP synthase F0 subunit 8 [Sitona obsoletus]
MPQMAPLNWLTLYFIFILLFIMFMILNYFSFTYSPKNFKKDKMKIILNWKW